ncbi:MAG: sulfatase-like hydrolase/transferase, partial [Deltaproteobacteria bacterium]|nr:sulfatase-like hydrolase/transferase [Deltaproteobacteria bacterium]
MPHQLRPRLAPPAAALLLAGVFLGGAEGLGPLLDGHPGLMTLSLDAWLVAALPLALAAVAGTCAVRLAAPRWAPAGRLLSFLGSPVPLERAWPAGVLLATGGVLVLGPLAGSFVRTGLERVTVEGLARLLSGLGTLLLLGLLALACFAAARLVLRTAGARWRAAVAPSHLAAWTLLTPVLGWSLALYRLHGEHLGAVVLPLGTGLLLLLGLLLWSPLSRLGDGLLRALVAVLVCGTLLVTAAAAARRPAEGEGPALASLPWTAAMTARLRSLTDLDGDAHSSVFGGGDCEPLDPEIHPGARDEPDNGVDENCDGEDAQEQEGLRLGDPTPRVLPGARRHNVVVVLMDALRGDRMHFLGYNRKTTPQLDRLAEEALVAERAYSQSSCSRKSIPSFLSGRYPQHMEWDRSQRYYGIEPGNVMLAELFREAGYQTAAVVNAWLKGRLQGFGQGFDSFVSVYTQKNWKDASNRSSPIAVVKAIEFLEHRDPDRPFLL